MEKTACLIESPPFRMKNDGLMSPPEKILQRKDIALVVPGALSCIRGVYTKAEWMGKLSQVFPCEVTKTEYAAGIQGKKLQETIQKALDTPGIGGVVIYASCLDILTQTDFDDIIKKLINPKNIPVKPLFRGPMVRRYNKPEHALRQVLDSMPETSETAAQLLEQLPPLYPDYNNIAAAFQHWGVYQFLMTPGGCGSILRDTSENGKIYSLRKSRINDIQLSLGCEQLLEDGIAEDFENSGYDEAFLLGSGVMSFCGVDYDRISRNLEKRGIKNTVFSSDGFTAGTIGVADAMLALGKKILKPMEKEAGRINVLGYSPFSVGRMARITHGIEHMAKRGFVGTIWGEGGMEEAKKASSAQMNWVVSAEGLPLARYMEEQFGIPYLAGIPTGMQSMIPWRKKVNQLMGKDDEVLPPNHYAEPLACQTPVLIIGEPLLTVSLEKAFRQEMGLHQITRAVYAPYASLRSFYKENLPDLLPILIKDYQDLKELVKPGMIVVADPLYRKYVDKLAAGCHFLAVPDPNISGEQFLDMPYEILGKKGAAYLRSFLEAEGIIQTG